MEKGMDIFVYGTLRDASIRDALLGHSVSRVTPSTITGFQARLVRGRDFPIIRPSPGGTTIGLILHDLSEEDVCALDKFEGDTYDLKDMTASLPDGQEQTVKVYVDCGVYEDGGPFDFDQWVSTMRHGFIETFMGDRGFVKPTN